jgi:AcrR family transcriptional regulator
MPKRKDLRPKILETAQELFNNASYNQVDTRKISKAAGIATGTLYNYFPTKKVLFFAVFERCWDESLDRLKHALYSARPQTDFIDLFLGTLYTEFKRNRRLGRTFFQLTVAEQTKKRDEHVKPTHLHKIADKLLGIFTYAVGQYAGRQCIGIQAEQSLQRMVLVLHLAIPVMENVYGDTPQENFRFLSQVIHAYIDMYVLSQKESPI